MYLRPHIGCPPMLQLFIPEHPAWFSNYKRETSFPEAAYEIRVLWWCFGVYM